MATGRCATCGVEEYMPYVCKFCQGRFCAAHRLPENHDCRGLEDYRTRVRAEGRLMVPEPGDRETMRPTVKAGARWRAGLGRYTARLEGRVTWVFLGAMVAVFVLQLFLAVAGQRGLSLWLFGMDDAFYLHPWVVVTSIFAHAGPFHLFLNGLILFFFGPTLEGLLGSRRFTILFLGAGMLGGLGEIGLRYVLPPELVVHVPVVGASGAIMGLLGTLTVLAPRITILLFFVVPAPLWAVTIAFALLDLYGALTPGRGGIAHVAHLSGLAAGLAYGKHLHDRGLRAQIRQAPPSRRF